MKIWTSYFVNNKIYLYSVYGPSYFKSSVALFFDTMLLMHNPFHMSAVSSSQSEFPKQMYPVRV